MSPGASHKLQGKERTQALAGIPGWTETEGRDAISRRFVFADFNAAFGFMSRIALYAERHDHHPEWLNVWRTVDVTLSTHSAGGLSLKDIEMARFMDRLADNP